MRRVSSSSWATYTRFASPKRTVSTRARPSSSPAPLSPSRGLSAAPPASPPSGAAREWPRWWRLSLAARCALSSISSAALSGTTAPDPCPSRPLRVAFSQNLAPSVRSSAGTDWTFFSASSSLSAPNASMTMASMKFTMLRGCWEAREG